MRLEQYAVLGAAMFVLGLGTPASAQSRAQLEQMFRQTCGAGVPAELRATCDLLRKSINEYEEPAGAGTFRIPRVPNLVEQGRQADQRAAAERARQAELDRQRQQAQARPAVPAMQTPPGASFARPLPPPPQAQRPEPEPPRSVTQNSGRNASQCLSAVRVDGAATTVALRNACNVPVSVRFCWVNPHPDSFATGLMCTKASFGASDIEPGQTARITSSRSGSVQWFACEGRSTVANGYYWTGSVVRGSCRPS